MTVFVKSWKNATEQHYYDNKIDKNYGAELERTFNSLNLHNFIHYSSFCDEDKH